MIRLLLSTAVSTALLIGASNAAVFNFSQQGYDGGGVFSGFFEGEDTNNDGQIVSFDGEVFDIQANYQGVVNGNENVFTQFDIGSLDGEQGSGLTGLVLFLDGGGTIGDNEGGAIEGFALDNGEFYIAVGPGPANLCDGINDCGFLSYSNGDIFDEIDEGPIDGGFILASSSDIINVTTGPTGDASDLGSPDNPFLPDEEDDPSDGFTFTITEGQITPFETFFIDPDIAVGYTYTITGNTFHSVTAPTLGEVNDADGQYTLTADGILTTLAAGETYIFGVGSDIAEFTLTDIEVMPGLDPLDPLAFQTGISVSTFTGSFTIDQTPIVETVGNPSVVPLPAGFLLLGSGLALLGASRRRKP